MMNLRQTPVLIQTIGMQNPRANQIFHLFLGGLTLLTCTAAATPAFPPAGLRQARAAFIGSLPVPLPAKAWTLREPPADATASPELKAYNVAVEAAKEWTIQANASDVLPHKGLWVRPYRRDYTALDVLEVMDNAQSLGITDLMVETFRGGRVIFPGNPTFPARYPENLLDIYTREGKRRGIKIHAWIHTLDFGPDWAKTHPETLVKDGFTNLSGAAERASYRVSPALPEVARELERLVDNVASHSADGIMLDYLRYPTRLKGDDIDETPDPRNFFGYNRRQLAGILRRYPEMALPEFKSFIETNRVSREEQREELLGKWKAALSEDLENLIASIRTVTASRLVLGAAYFPDYYFHRHDTRLQESKRWASQFDLLSPLCYQYYLDEFPAPYGTYTIHRALEIVEEALAHLPPDRVPLLLPSLTAEVPGTPQEATFHHRTLREQTAFVKGRVFDRAFPRVRGVAYFAYGWIFQDSENRRRSGG